MSKLCLCTYLQVLTIYKCPQDSGQLRILNALVKCICDDPEPLSPQQTSHIINGKRNLPRVIRDEIYDKRYTAPHYFENFKSNVEILLHPNKLNDICKVLKYIAFNDSDIDEECIIDYVSQTKNNDYNHPINPKEFIAGVFLYVLRISNLKSEKYASEITEEYCKRAINEYDSLTQEAASSLQPASIQGIIMDSDIASQAKAFCRFYENDIALLPLCQIANIINPCHNHVNKMYSDYCNYSNELKKQIMKEISCPMIAVDDKYALYNLLGCFTDDIERLELASRDTTYMFTQYILKTLSYEDSSTLTDPRIFPVIPTHYTFPGYTKTNLSQFINNYLYCKENNKEHPVPFSWMCTNLNLLTCPEEELVLWLNLFIISCCYNICDSPFALDSKYESPALPNIDDTKTLEDLHFLALLMLYNTYMCN